MNLLSLHFMMKELDWWPCCCCDRFKIQRGVDLNIVSDNLIFYADSSGYSP